MLTVFVRPLRVGECSLVRSVMMGNIPAVCMPKLAIDVIISAINAAELQLAKGTNTNNSEHRIEDAETNNLRILVLEPNRWRFIQKSAAKPLKKKLFEKSIIND